MCQKKIKIKAKPKIKTPQICIELTNSYNQ